MTDAGTFGGVIALVSLALLGAVLSHRLAGRINVPAPALFLLLAAVASTVFPGLGRLSAQVDERIVTVALVIILFDGGLSIGWRRFRVAAGAIVWLGIAGTVVTAGALAVAAHGLFDLSWRSALLLGTALAPTDPAVVFSVLGRREIVGRSGTLLEGESGANDPVGIALMVALLGSAGGGAGGAAVVWHGVGVFALQLAVGGAIGVVGGWGLKWMFRLRLPHEVLYPIRAIAAAGLIYGVAAWLHGSGFLAVLLAGILVGDAEVPRRREVGEFTGGLAGFAEILAFSILGLTVSVKQVFQTDEWLLGLAMAGLLVVVVRPLFGALLLWPIRLRLGEKAFVLFAGLKGAVPILLGLLIVESGTPDGERLYDIVFVAVLSSVIVQGVLVPVMLDAFGIPTTTRGSEV